MTTDTLTANTLHMCHASVVKYPCSLSLSLSGPFGIREWRVPYVGTE